MKKRALAMARKPLNVQKEAVGYKIAQFVDAISAKYALTLAQRMFLMLRWRFRTDAECARVLGIRSKTIYEWKEPSPAHVSRFKEAYEEFFSGFEGIIQAEMEGLLGKVVQRVDEMLDASKSWITVGGEERTAPDHEARFKGVQAVLHFLGRWGPQNRVEVNNMNVNLTEEFAKLVREKAKKAAGELIDGDYQVVARDDA